MSRLDPNVKTPVTTVIANTAPKMADRTGTALRPLPGSSAKRTPVTADAGSPAEAVARNRRCPIDPPAALASHPVGRSSVGQSNRQDPQDGDEHEHTETEHRPVERHSRRRVHRTNGPERCEGRECHGHCERQQRADDHGAEDADQPVGRGHGGTRTEGTDHSGVVRPEPQLAPDHLGRDEDGRQGGDPPEDAEGDRLGPDGSFRRGDDQCRPAGAGTGAGSRKALSDDTIDLRLHDGHLTGAPADLQGARRVRGAALGQLAGERRGEEAHL